MEKLGARARLPADCRAEPVGIGPCAAEWIIPAQAADGEAINRIGEFISECKAHA